MDRIKLVINEREYEISRKYESETLLFVIREVIGLTGTKKSCETNDCGACKILLDGEPVNSCAIKAKKAIGCHIETIEGLQKGNTLHPIQQAFIDAGAVQCGFCTPGMIITAKAFLDHNINPTREEVRDAIQGNICRCTGYVKIVDAIILASERLNHSRGENL